MAYDEKLGERVRQALAGRRDLAEKRMFGGIAFLARGHMVAGVVKDDLMLRVGPDAYDTYVEKPHARPMDFTGKPMKGFLFVGPAGVKTSASLERWLRPAIELAESLPRKPRR